MEKPAILVLYEVPRDATEALAPPPTATPATVESTANAAVAVVVSSDTTAAAASPPPSPSTTSNSTSPTTAAAATLASENLPTWSNWYDRQEFKVNEVIGSKEYVDRVLEKRFETFQFMECFEIGGSSEQGCEIIYLNICVYYYYYYNNYNNNYYYYYYYYYYYQTTITINFYSLYSYYILVT